MRGEVIHIDDVSGGLISGDDGLRYGFDASAVTGGSLAAGDRVDFVAEDGLASQIVILAPSSPGPWSGQGAATAAAPAAGAPVARPGFDLAFALFAFNGRLRQSHFWIAWLIVFGVGVVLNFIPLLNLLGLVLLWPHLAMGVKRLHDMGRSGWLIAIPYGVMVAGWVYAIAVIGLSAMANYQALENEDPAALVAMFAPAFIAVSLTWIVGVAFWLWIGLSGSQRGPNKYGTEPQG